MLYTRTNLVRLTLLVLGTFAAAACGDASTAEPRELRNLVYCENPEVASPSCGLTGYSMADDSELRTKLEGCAVAGCHAAPSATFTLDLSKPVSDALASLTASRATNGDYVIDDVDPDCSNMLTKLTNQPAGGLRMPPPPYSPPYWSGDEIDCFRSYLHQMYPQ